MAAAVTEQALLKRITTISSAYNAERVRAAFVLAEQSYRGQGHWTGERLLEHVVGVAEELQPFQPDEDTLIACLLHHVLETKQVSLLELEEQFGSKVRSMVSGVHLLSHVTLQGKRTSIEDLRLMLLSVSDDIRILFVTMCDRVHCLHFLGKVPRQNAQLLSQDALNLFAPVAARLGIYRLKHEFERLAFPYAYQSDAQHIEEQLQRFHEEFPQLLDHCIETLQEFLAKQGITAEIDAREKQPYSLFLKMQQKAITHISDVYDLLAIRVVVETEEDCYRVLGMLHRLGRPLTNRFKDYIAFPKPNGYQSLHTTLASFAGAPEGAFIEVQIRTTDMHREAMYGVAAHWSYKEHGATDRALEKVQLHSMLVGQDAVDDSGPVFSDHIFVLTPQGDIIELPEGATPLDFAFQVHTDLGLSFRSARVNGSIVSLDYELENGDVVEITKYASPQPSPQWLHVVRMASSKSKLRRYLQVQDKPAHVARGRELLNIELRKRGLSPLTTDLSLLRTLSGQKLSYAEREDVLAKVGQDAERASSILSKLEVPKRLDSQVKKEKTPALHAREALVGIQDDLRMPVRFAKCCNPKEWPREAIIGNVNRSGEVMIHRHHCRMCKNSNPDRRVEVWWTA